MNRTVKKDDSPASVEPRAHVRGFTLVEIIIFITVLIILVAAAVPRFVNVTGGATQSQVDAIAEALTAASARNYSLSISGSGNAFTVSNCTHVAQGLPPGQGLPAGYTVSSIAVATHARITCTVTHTNGSNSANFIAVGT